jgi:hypothetical protein
VTVTYWKNWSTLYPILAKKKPNPKGSGYELQIVFRNGAAILIFFPDLSGIGFLICVPKFAPG